MKITEDCMSCGQCAEVCRNEAIQMKKGQGYKQYTIDKDKCFNCGRCLDADCPAGAILED